MAAAFAFVVIQAILIQAVFGQCMNRVVPGCQSNLMEAIMPNQVYLREQVLPGVPPVIPGPIPTPILPAAEIGYAPTIIQDSSVANSLANALQLLVVSSLLSNTLPGPCDYPAYPTYPVETLVAPSPYGYFY